MKCLLGVDAKGGIMFISQLYEGAISDKQIVERSGFLEILRQKVMSEKIKKEIQSWQTMVLISTMT